MFFLAAADPSKPLSMAGISAALRLSAKQEAIRVCKDSVGRIACSHAAVGRTDCARMGHLALTGRGESEGSFPGSNTITLVLSPQVREIRKKVSVISFNS